MTKPETEKLLPCPHCGGAPTVHTEGWDAAQFIRCTECSANTRLFKTREEAVAAWNRRTAPAAIGYIGPGELAWLKDGAYHATIYPNAAAGFVPIYTDLPMIRAQGGGVTPDAAPDAVEWADEAMAMHWIDRYASGVDDEPQMDRVLDCVRVSPADDAIIDFVRDVAANRDPHLHCRRAIKLINAHARSAGGEGRDE